MKKLLFSSLLLFTAQSTYINADLFSSIKDESAYLLTQYVAPYTKQIILATATTAINATGLLLYHRFISKNGYIDLERNKQLITNEKLQADIVIAQTLLAQMQMQAVELRFKNLAEEIKDPQEKERIQKEFELYLKNVLQSEKEKVEQLITKDLPILKNKIEQAANNHNAMVAQMVGHLLITDDEE